MAFERSSNAMARAPLFGRLIDELGHDLHPDSGLVVLVDELGQLRQRLDDALGQHQEGEQCACVDAIIRYHGEVDADRKSAGNGEALERSHPALDEIGHHAFGEARLGHLRDMHVPEVALPRVKRQRLDGTHSEQGLDQERAAFHLRVLRHVRLLAVSRQHEDEPERDKPADRHDDGGHDGAEEEHHRQEDEQHDRVEQGAEHLPNQEGTDLPHLVDLVVDLSDGRALEIIDGKTQRLLEHVGGEFDVDPRGQAKHEELP